jgi:hypothetical protein
LASDWMAARQADRGRVEERGQRPKRIHITGSPRSGTTLFLALMLACFDVDGGIRDERRLWRTPPKDRRIVCTKFPDETGFAASMLPLDPDLHVIFVVRDPRDVIVSQSHVDPDRYLTNLRVWKHNLEAAKPWFGHSRFHVVDYSELAADPDRVQERLAFDMPFLRTVRLFSRFQDCAGEEDGAWLNRMHMKLRPVTSDSVGQWRNHLSRLKGQLLVHGDISDDLITMGFEQDKSWLDLLAGVRPDLSPSATIEHVNLSKRITRMWRNTIGTIVYIARRYFNIELSSTGEKMPVHELPYKAANENSSISLPPDKLRSSGSL